MADRDSSTSDEIWYPIPGLPGYELSSEMRVRKPEIICVSSRFLPSRCVETGRWRILKLPRIKGRLMFHYSYAKNKRKVIYLHRAIAMVAYGSIPDGLLVRHYDDDVTNNYASNLCFGTHLDNATDKERNGRTARGEKIASSRLTDDKVRAIRSRFAELKRSEAVRRVSREFGLSKTTVIRIIKGITWAHVT